MQLRTIDGLSVRFAESAPGSPGVRTTGGPGELAGNRDQAIARLPGNHDYGPQSAADQHPSQARPRGPHRRPPQPFHSLTRWPVDIFSAGCTPTRGNGTRCLRSGLVVPANASGLTAAWSGRSMALYRRVRTAQAIGGGSPCTLAASAGSQPQTAHACRTADRPNSSAARCGSALARASSQSSTNSPSPASQRAAAGDNDAAANPAGAG
jgi:hypothetical protein